MIKCDNDMLASFSMEHFTYINQIFGDKVIRQIISEVFPNKIYDFGIEESGEEFEHSYHHILVNKKTLNPECSVNNGYQNLNKNINDNLCQSYSLLTYFNKNIDPDQKQRQIDMINMYRNIISNDVFIKILDEIIIPSNKKLWIDYTKTSTQSKNYYIPLNKIKILSKINTVLDNWEEYGFWYFIGKGKCPNNNKKTRRSRSRSRSRSRIDTRITRSRANL